MLALKLRSPSLRGDGKHFSGLAEDLRLDTKVPRLVNTEVRPLLSRVTTVLSV